MQSVNECMDHTGDGFMDDDHVAMRNMRTVVVIVVFVWGMRTPYRYR